MYRKAWPRLRNSPSGKQNYASVATAVEAQALGHLVSDYSSYQRCSTQSLRSFFIGKLGNVLGSGQYRAKWSSSVQFSTSCHSSIQSSQWLVPSSVSVLRCLPSANAPAPDMRDSLLKVRRNSSLAEVSSFSDGGDRGDWRDRNVDSSTSGKSPRSFVERAILFDSEERDETRSTAGKDIGNEASRSEERFSSHAGSNVKSSQTKPHPNWNERRPQNAEAVQQWTLYLNRQQRGFRPHLSGLKLLNSIVPSPSLSTRCKSLVSD